jgi:periplasmic protein TonB
LIINPRLRVFFGLFFAIKNQMKKVPKSLLGSLALHVGLLSLVLGSAYFKAYNSKPSVPVIDVDLVDIEFTTLDQDLSKIKATLSKASKPNKTKELEATIPKKNIEPVAKDESSIKDPSLKDKAKQDQVVDKTTNESITNIDAQTGSEEGTSKLTAKIRMSYEQYLISYINRYKTYPRIAERLKQQGVVVPKIIISKDGKLKEIVIEKSSGFSSLDQGTINLIKSLAPFKPLPENLQNEDSLSNNEEYTIKIPIGYTLIGS